MSSVKSLMVLCAVISSAIGASSPAADKTLIDYFLPMPIQGRLVSDVWGAPGVFPRDPRNGLEDETMKQWCYWDGQIIKGPDGKYHMVASRWDQARGHNGWWGSLAVHAVSDQVMGPYIDKGLCWPDNQGGKGHNVTALVLPDGRYAVVVSETRPGDVFVSKSLDGPWEYLGSIKVAENEFSRGGRMSNVSIMVRPDGDFMIVPRSGAILISKDGILGPYTVQGPSVYPSIAGLPLRNLEDPVVWYSGGLYHIVVNGWSDRKAYHITSVDGINNWTFRGLAYDPTTDFLRYTGGTVNHWDKIERPGVVLENGHVTHFTFAVLDVPKNEERGNDTHGSKIIVVPFDGAALDRDLQNLSKTGQPQVRAGAPIEMAPLPKLPRLKPLFDYPVRDTSVCVGHDGAYYLTGTTGAPDWWAVTGDIQVWRSADLKEWRPVVEKPRQRSVVWNIDRDGTWEKRIPTRDGAPFRPLWAPEIAFIKGTYWICYSIPLGAGGGVLKSTSRKPEGPYEAMFKDAPAVNAIDLALFADDDGKVYLVWGAGNIRELNPEMNGFVGDGWKLKPANADRIGFEGTYVFKRDGRYYITGAEFVLNPEGGSGSDYHCYAAVGDSLRGPFREKFLAIPHAGHNSFFRDRDGNWWATFFGNDARSPFRERPAALRIEFLPDGRFTFAREQPNFVLKE